MPHVLAAEEEDDLLGDVLGVVADALVGLGDEDELDVRGGDARGVAGLPEQREVVLLVQAVDLPVVLQDGLGLAQVALDEAVHRGPQGGGGEATLLGDHQEVGERAPAGDGQRAPGDARGLVGDALEVVADVARAEEQADVAAHRAEERQVAHDLAVDALLEVVHPVVHPADLEGQLVVALLEGLEREAGHVEGALAHQDEVVAELAELLMEETLHGEEGGGLGGEDREEGAGFEGGISRSDRRCRPRSGDARGS